MSLVEFRDWNPKIWSELAAEEFEHRLHSVCGRFHPHLADDVFKVRGDVVLQDASGLELARVSNNLSSVCRDQKDIRLDFGGNFFLIIQLEGECGIEQNGTQSQIGPGDCILLDSSTPLLLSFAGKFSDHLSVHLPRQLLLSEKVSELEVSRQLGVEDPMSAVLRGLVAKISQTSAENARAPHLRHLLFQATRQAFARDADAHYLVVDSSDSRLEAAQLLIDRHLTDECLSLAWLARRLGVSARTLQNDFNRVDWTVTSMIRTRRLFLARDKLAEMRNRAGKATIADVAYSAGFNDISYFNRSFKEVFQQSPRDFLRA